MVSLPASIRDDLESLKPAIRLARAAYDWWSTTHFNAEHDHHCPALKQAKTGRPCDCGWSEFLDAYDEYVKGIPEDVE